MRVFSKYFLECLPGFERKGLKDGGRGCGVRTIFV